MKVHLLKTLREVYDLLYKQELMEYFEVPMAATSVDKAFRCANIYAITHTVNVWKQQFKG